MLCSSAADSYAMVGLLLRGRSLVIALRGIYVSRKFMDCVLGLGFSPMQCHRGETLSFFGV
jgi:hypothetical protein